MWKSVCQSESQRSHYRSATKSNSILGKDLIVTRWLRDGGDENPSQTSLRLRLLQWLVSFRGNLRNSSMPLWKYEFHIFIRSCKDSSSLLAFQMFSSMLQQENKFQFFRCTQLLKIHLYQYNSPRRLGNTTVPSVEAAIKHNFNVQSIPNNFLIPPQEFFRQSTIIWSERCSIPLGTTHTRKIVLQWRSYLPPRWPPG